MMDKSALVLCFLSAFIVPQIQLSIPTPCADFLFPVLTDSILKFREGETLNFTFKIDNYTHCISHQSERFSIHVTKITETKDFQCVLVHKESKCQNTVQGGECKCGPEEGTYLFTHTVDRSDNWTTWKWSTDTGIVRETSFVFNVIFSNEAQSTAPPSYTSLLSTVSYGAGPSSTQSSSSASGGTMAASSKSNTSARSLEERSTASSIISKEAHGTITIVVVAVVIIVGILSFSASLTICYVKKVSQTHVVRQEMQNLRQELQELQRPAIPPVHELENGSSSESLQSHHTYHEVQEEEESVSEPRPSRRHCQAPDEAPENYLHPTSTTSDLPSSESSSYNPNPRYQNC